MGHRSLELQFYMSIEFSLHYLHVAATGGLLAGLKWMAGRDWGGEIAGLMEIGSGKEEVGGVGWHSSAGVRAT